MDLLERVIGLVKDVPDMAIWVLAGIFLYKTIIVGSIFGILKLLIVKGHDIFTSDRTVYHSIRDLTHGKFGEEALDRLLRELMDNRGKIEYSAADNALKAYRDFKDDH